MMAWCHLIKYGKPSPRPYSRLNTSYGNESSSLVTGGFWCSVDEHGTVARELHSAMLAILGANNRAFCMRHSLPSREGYLTVLKQVVCILGWHKFTKMPNKHWNSFQKQKSITGECVAFFEMSYKCAKNVIILKI